MAAEEKSLSQLSNTPSPKSKRKKQKKSLAITDIDYLNIHSEKISAEKGNTTQIKKANNTANNDKREQLIEYIFNMEADDSFLQDEQWYYWYEQANKIKSKLQKMFKDETGETNDGIFRIKHMGGSKYSYDFAVHITSQDNRQRTFIPLEYKHQGSLGILPQFYQVGNVSKPFFARPYHDYYYDTGLPEINKMIGIDIKLRTEDRDTYSKLIGKSVYSEKDWEKIRQGTLTNCSPISEQLQSLRKTYERGKEGSPTYKKQQKIVKQTITNYLKEMKETDGINVELIDAIQEQITNKQKPTDHNGMHKDKIYMLCGYENGNLVWNLDRYPPGDFILERDPTQVIVEKDRLLFPTQSGQYLEIRLRWQNVTGLCNPSWQFKIGAPPKTKTKRTPRTANRTVSNTTTKRKRCPKGFKINRKTGLCVQSNTSTTMNTTVNRKRKRSLSNSPTRKTSMR